MAETCKFSITVTLQSKMFKYPSEEQYDLTYRDVMLKLREYCTRVSLVAEHTKAFNVHYHGMISMHNVPNARKRLSDAFRRHPTIGFICIKQIDDEDGWVKYLSKDIPTTKVTLSRPPILRDDYDIFDKNLLLYNWDSSGVLACE